MQRRGMLGTSGWKLEQISSGPTAKEKGADKQQGGWTTRIFKGEMTSKGREGSYGEKDEKKVGKGLGGN